MCISGHCQIKDQLFEFIIFLVFLFCEGLLEMGEQQRRVLFQELYFSFLKAFSLFSPLLLQITHQHSYTINSQRHFRMHKTQQKLRVKKKIRINSLEAAICNVALFKSMKDKDFRDSIFISYCQDGVILEAISEAEWKRAHDYIENFLKNKKIQLLIDGYDKDEYEALINKGLKQITRRIRQRDEQCPYINIIHYQKLRKSCEYMDKEKYVDPLKDWQKKNKKNSNFAFLIVEPKSKFDEVKKSLLQFLLNEPINYEQITVEPLYFMYLIFYSPIKQKIKNHYNRRQMQIFIQKQEQDSAIKITNFTNVNINQFGYSIVKSQSNITKSGVGLQVIPSYELKNEIKNAKMYCKDNPTELIESAIEEVQLQYGQNFIIVPYRRQEQQKYKGLIQKYTNTKFSKEQIERKIQMHQICQAQDIEYLGEMFTSKNYKAYRVFINNCPFMVHQYQASHIDMDTFMIYLDQLQLFYCTYMVRYYGLAVRYSRSPQNLSSQQPQSYLLVFDYHRSTLLDMLENDMIIDCMQVATMVLQILYLIDFLHSHEQPRCLGPICSNQIFWPMATVLPYLGLTNQEPLYSIENDVKQAGVLMRELLGEQVDEDFIGLLLQMTNQSKYDRPSVRKCINKIQQLLCL